MSDGSRILDLVGYGPTANCFEASPAAAPGNATADVRKGGAAWTTTITQGFLCSHTAPRNSSSPANACSGQTTDIAISDVK